MASLMRDAGYRTTLVGKWHLGALPKYGPLKSGYDEFWGLYGGGVDYFRHGFGGQADLWDGETRIEEAGYLTDLLADRAIDTLERRKADGAPFFITLHFTAPHWPWESNDAEGQAESDRIAASARSEGGGGILHYDGGNLATYARMVKSLDDNIGRVLERLGARPRPRHDRGLHQRQWRRALQRHLAVHRQEDRAARRRDARARDRALARGGPRRQPQQRADHVDGLAADLRRRRRRAAEPGFPERRGRYRRRARAARCPSARSTGATATRSQRAHRRGDYKYLKINDNEFLFDVVADPLERADLKGRQPERFAELKAAWEQWDVGMLHDPSAPSAGNAPANLADHFNSPPPPPRRPRRPRTVRSCASGSPGPAVGPPH